MSAARGLLGEPLVHVLASDTPEEALAAALAALRDRYGSWRVSRALKTVLTKGRVGRPRKARLEPRERRLLLLYDVHPRRTNGQPDNKGFAALFCDELGGHSAEAAEKQLQRLLAARERQARKTPHIRTRWRRTHFSGRGQKPSV